MITQMVLKPRLSEKAYGQSIKSNTYAFIVPGEANKLTVASAVAEQFGVNVTSVNILNILGKTKRSYSKGSRKYINGQRSDAKKAYVTLKQGDSIPIFASEEEPKETKTEKAVAKAVKKIAKKAAKS